MPVVAEARAWELLTTPKYPKLTWFWNAIRLHDQYHANQFLKIETVWMPFHRVTFQTEGQEKDKTSSLDTTVDAWSGAFAIVSFESELHYGYPPGEYFQPQLDENDACDIAYKQFLHTVMRQRSRGKKPLPKHIHEVSLLYWPFWILYIQRKRMLDIRLLDAVTAQPGGNRTKVGILQAFTAAQSSYK